MNNVNRVVLCWVFVIILSLTSHNLRAISRAEEGPDMHDTLSQNTQKIRAPPPRIVPDLVCDQIGIHIGTSQVEIM